ncbi:hypothetical protein ACM66B_006209 [Microbotryomycetes sp. NB124-2]
MPRSSSQHRSRRDPSSSPERRSSTRHRSKSRSRSDARSDDKKSRSKSARDYHDDRLSSSTKDRSRTTHKSGRNDEFEFDSDWEAESKSRSKDKKAPRASAPPDSFGGDMDLFASHPGNQSGPAESSYAPSVAGSTYTPSAYTSNSAPAQGTSQSSYFAAPSASAPPLANGYQAMPMQQQQQPQQHALQDYSGQNQLAQLPPGAQAFAYGQAPQPAQQAWTNQQQQQQPQQLFRSISAPPAAQQAPNFAYQPAQMNQWQQPQTAYTLSQSPPPPPVQQQQPAYYGSSPQPTFQQPQYVTSQPLFAGPAPSAPAQANAYQQPQPHQQYEMRAASVPPSDGAQPWQAQQQRQAPIMSPPTAPIMSPPTAPSMPPPPTGQWVPGSNGQWTWQVSNASDSQQQHVQSAPQPYPVASAPPQTWAGPNAGYSSQQQAYSHPPQVAPASAPSYQMQPAQPFLPPPSTQPHYQTAFAAAPPPAPASTFAPSVASMPASNAPSALPPPPAPVRQTSYRDNSDSALESSDAFSDSEDDTTRRSTTSSSRQSKPTSKSTKRDKKKAADEWSESEGSEFSDSDDLTAKAASDDRSRSRSKRADDSRKKQSSRDDKSSSKKDSRDRSSSRRREAKSLSKQESSLDLQRQRLEHAALEARREAELLEQQFQRAKQLRRASESEAYADQYDEMYKEPPARRRRRSVGEAFRDNNLLFDIDAEPEQEYYQDYRPAPARPRQPQPPVEPMQMYSLPKQPAKPIAPSKADRIAAWSASIPKSTLDRNVYPPPPPPAPASSSAASSDEGPRLLKSAMKGGRSGIRASMSIDSRGHQNGPHRLRRTTAEFEEVGGSLDDVIDPFEPASVGYEAATARLYGQWHPK